ncbi:uncharacterized protein LOC111115585 [Crassostrea virginica]
MLHFNHKLIIFTLLYGLFKSEQIGICSNSSEGNPLKCCQHYRVVGNSCVECWPGTHGINCNQTCPSGFYGRFCAEVCPCYPCDIVMGCINITTNDSYSQLQMITTESISATPQAIDIGLVTTLSVSLAICFTFSLALFCVFRWYCTAGTFNRIASQHNFEAHFSNERDSQINLQAKKDQSYEDNYRNVPYPKMSQTGLELSSPSQTVYGWTSEECKPYDILTLSNRNIM